MKLQHRLGVVFFSGSCCREIALQWRFALRNKDFILSAREGISSDIEFMMQIKRCLEMAL